jgi:hypothetical protein
MITLVLLALVTLALACCIALRQAQKNAVVGYEDKRGFHPGVQPGTFATAEIHEIHTHTDCAA